MPRRKPEKRPKKEGDARDKKSFFWRLTEEVARSSGRESFVTSPISIELGLAMIYLGAEGATKEELRRLLGLEGRAEARTKYRGWLEALWGTGIRWGHALFLSQDVELEEEYEQEAWETFRCDLVPFSPEEEDGLRNAVNDWAEPYLESSDVDCLDEGSLESEGIVLGSSLYCSLRWETPFDFRLTGKEYFYPEGGGKRYVKMMSLNGVLPYQRLSECTLIKFPLDDGLALLFLMSELPEGLGPLIPRLEGMNLPRLALNLPGTRLKVRIPTMTEGYLMDYAPLLHDLGLRSPFSPGDADLSRLSSSSELYLGSFLHRVVLRTDEGTLLASSVGLEHGAPPQDGLDENPLLDLKSFVANRPFLYFLIHEPSQNIIIVGRYS